jgi:GNAT superfamily N-acetyltransferase
VRRTTALAIRPLTPGRFADLERLFGPRGASGGCWCMFPRLSRAAYEAQKGEGNRRALRRLVDQGGVPGVLAYEGREPVGWCAIEPREAFPRIGRSRLFKPVDDRPAWAIVCLFVRRDRRGRGISRALISGAAAHARRRGARLVEAYPVDPKDGRMPTVFAWTGIASAFRAQGFAEAARRSPTRPLMRLTLRGPSPRAARRVTRSAPASSASRRARRSP